MINLKTAGRANRANQCPVSGGKAAVPQKSRDGRVWTQLRHLVAAHLHRIPSVPPVLREKRPTLRPATQVCLLDHGPLNPSWPRR